MDAAKKAEAVEAEVRELEAALSTADTADKDDIREKLKWRRVTLERLNMQMLAELRGAAAAGPSSAATTGAPAVLSMAAFDRPKVVLRIKFSLLNMQHIRDNLWRKMKEGGLWGSVRRTSASEVKCDVVCHFQNGAAFYDLIRWLNNIGVVEKGVGEKAKRVVKSDPTVLIYEGQPHDFCTSDEDALKMVGRRQVVALSQHMKAKAPSTDPSDAANSHSSLPSADRYGP